MLFKAKPHLYLRFYEKSISYLSIDPQKRTIVDKGYLIFDTPLLQEGKVTNPILIKTRLDALVKEKKWKNTKVSILLPDDFVTIRFEKIPSQLDGSEVKDYLDLHINTSIRLPFDHPKVDFEIVEKTEENQTVLLVAFPGEEVRIYLDLLQDIGLKPEVADISSLSVYRVVKELDTLSIKSSDHVMLLQWHPLDLSITVFNNDIPQFNRQTRLSRLSDSWSMTEDGIWTWKQSKDLLQDNLNDQLNGLERFMEFYRYSVLNGEGTIDSVVLTGSYPHLDLVKGLLEERFPLEVHTLSMPDQLTPTDAGLYGLSLKQTKKEKSVVKSKEKKTHSFKKPFATLEQTQVKEEGEG
ncbi:type IV pilus biogenesis protein PilM [Alkalibacterium sp. MB6]|uniref:type IV pilus biogenesis protein PilM n=1 Tax=Alkalibacterium sp. MB6 TaxID=2081965 RepID=UPI00137A91D2|nr:pilus assembly protein PilM [Alkalibacterium sp. MB6]